MQYELVCHPDFPATSIAGVSVRVCTIADRPTERSFEFHVASAAQLHVPAVEVAARRDGLWKTTCFEIFLQRHEDPGYTEINLSPSFEWAAYIFEGYRAGMGNMELAFDPDISVSAGRDPFFLDSGLDVSRFAPEATAMGVSAVIEEKDGTKSYWALAHSPGPPDFHNPACFIATLSPPLR